MLLQYVYNFFFCGCKVIGSIVQCFVKCIGDDVYLAYNVMEFMGILAGFVDKVGGVVVIDYYYGVIFVCQVVNFIQFSNIFIYRKYFICSDQVVVGRLCFFKFFFQVSYIVVFVVVMGSFVQMDFINNRGMVKFI